MNAAMRNRTRLTIGMVVAVVFVFLFFKNVDLSQLPTAATRAHPSVLLICLGFLILEYGLRIVRWWVMLRVCAPDVAMRACVPPLIVSVAVNNVVPLRAGDAFRVIGFGQQLNTPPAQLLSTLIIERLLDVTIIFLFLLAGLAILSDAKILAIYHQIAIAVASAVVLGWIVFLTAAQWLQRALLWMCRIQLLRARGWKQAAEQHVTQFIAALALIQNPRRALQLIAISAVIWSCNGAIFATVAHDLGYQGAPFGPWFSLSTATLATLIPSSPGYVGAFDYFAMSGLMMYGASQAMAAVFALVVHAVLWLPTTAAGLIYILLSRSRLRLRKLI